MQSHLMDKTSIDNVLSQIIERYETQFPGRIRACYLTGSYAESNAVEASDIDVYVLFKDAFVSEGEAAQAEQLGLACALLTPLRLDLTARSEQSQDSLPGYIRVAIKQKSLLLYGEDTRERMSLPGKEEYTRDVTEIALKFLLWLHQAESITYPLAYPDPGGAFFGYDQSQASPREQAPVRRGIRLLVECVCRIATALLAFKTDCYVGTKRDSVQTYRELINDEWASFLEALFEKGKLRWSYNLPEDEEDRAELRTLCERMLFFENHYLHAYRAYLLIQLRSGNEAARQLALQRLKQVIYSDEEITTAVQAASLSHRPIAEDEQ